MRHIVFNNGYFVIRFQYLPSLVDKVKALPGRRWNPDLKAWVVPEQSRAEVEQFAKSYRFTLSAPVAAAQPKPQEFPEVELPSLSAEINLKGKLFGFQEKGVAYILDKKRLIVGDQMGLGKTVQAIAAITASNAFPCLVICPASLKLNWEREWAAWTNHKAMVMSDNVKRTFKLFYEANLAKVFIVNYESLKKYFVADMPKGGKKLSLKDITFNDNKDFFKSVIIDEAHRVKDPKAQQTKFTRGIADGKEWVLALTGTPVVNKPSDLASQLAIIGRIGEFGGYWKFLQEYGENPSTLDLKELNYRLKTTCFYRRDKSEATDLPPKTRQVVMCDITTRNEYEEALRDLVTYLKKYRQATDDQVARSMRGEVMVRIGILKNISARGKIEACCEFIKDTLDNGEKLILFGHLREVLGKLKGKFPHVSITGEDPTIDRQKAIDQFQNNPGVNLIICSIAAAGVGITLTASSTVAFIEMGWHPAIMEQAEDRAHRIGQKDHVNCIYFIGKGTIDEWVYKLINDKRGISNTVTGAKDDVEENILDELIGLFNQKYNIS